MIKRCLMCGLEISDTDYDSQQRFNRIQYCDTCIAVRKAQQKRESKQRSRQRQRAERAFFKEQQMYKDAQDVVSLREQARAVREQRVNLMHGMTTEQRLRTELKQAEREIAALRRSVQQAGCDFINQVNKYNRNSHD